jgi:hypothetical protein
MLVVYVTSVVQPPPLAPKPRTSKHFFSFSSRSLPSGALGSCATRAHQQQSCAKGGGGQGAAASFATALRLLIRGRRLRTSNGKKRRKRRRRRLPGRKKRTTIKRARSEVIECHAAPAHVTMLRPCRAAPPLPSVNMPVFACVGPGIVLVMTNGCL